MSWTKICICCWMHYPAHKALASICFSWCHLATISSFLGFLMWGILLGARVLERFRVIASELMMLNLQLSHQEMCSWWWLWWWWERELAFGSTWDAFGFHFTYSWLLHFTALLLLPRVHRIGTEMALRDHGNCKLCLCCSSLCVSVYWLLLMVCLLKNVDLISLEPNQKTGYILCKMQCLIIASVDQTTWFGRKFFCSPCRSTVTGVLFGSFTMVGSHIREDMWTSNLSEFTCQWSHTPLLLVSILLPSLGSYPALV